MRSLALGFALSLTASAAFCDAAAQADVFVAITTPSPVFQAEGRSLLDVTIGNIGQATATNVVLDVDLPPGSRAISRGGLDDFHCDLQPEHIVCRTASLATSGPEAFPKMRIVFMSPPLFDGGNVRADARISADVDASPTNNRSFATWIIPKLLAVTTTADDGAGSLRDTITSANSVCNGPATCTLGFRIPGPLPASGFFTIRPKTPLPAATFYGTIDGTTEADVFDAEPNAPFVFLDGSQLADPDADGLRLAAANLAPINVAGLAIGNFPRYGIHVVSESNGGTLIATTYAGVDPTLARAPNLRGIVSEMTRSFLDVESCVVSANRRSGIVANANVRVANSRIENNGATGIYLPRPTAAEIRDNVIAWNLEYAIGLHPAQHSVQIVRNAIVANGGSVDYGLDGRNANADDDSLRPPNYPIVDDAHYDPATNKTIITLHLVSHPAPKQLPRTDESISDITAQLFANDPGTDQAQRFLTSTAANQVTIDGDLRGESITAMTLRHRVDCYFDDCVVLYETSEISPMLPVR